MKVRVETTPIQDVLIVHPEVFQDARGFFLEVYRQDVFAEAGLPTNFVQLNHSRSARDVTRGLHFQWDPPMGKLMRVTHGAAFLVAVDIRKGSPTLGKWFGTEITAESKRQLWAPAGFARGFCVLSDAAEIEYLTTGTYNARGEAGIRWDDPAIGVTWPVSTPILSDRDRNAPSLSEWLARPESNHFTFSG
jgi:dTDP-4-dehydrorhamnose 3,5-epimerase